MPLSMLMTRIWITMSAASLVCLKASKKRYFASIALSAVCCAVLDIMGVGDWEQTVLFFAIFTVSLTLTRLFRRKKK